MTSAFLAILRRDLSLAVRAGGGGELALWTSIPRELIIVIQALVILFTGALDNMVRMPLERMFMAMRKQGDA